MGIVFCGRPSAIFVVGGPGVHPPGARRQENLDNWGRPIHQRNILFSAY
ncbi:hypothetical protein J2129_001781 [Methanofollis sp. W23]|nr:hypothetical protein [Methanofollis sp. W23]